MKHLKIFEEFRKGNEPVFVKKSGVPFGGLGLFAARDMEEGEDIAEFTGEEISEEESLELEGERQHYLIAKADGSILDVFNSDSPAIRANDARGTKFENNAEIQESDEGEIWLVAIKNIKQGEEIFCSYGDDYWDNWSE